MAKLQFLKIAIYLRRSHDDEKAGDSVSIENQRMILNRYVTENGGTVTDEYKDDGWSGTNFDRPDVKRMLNDAQAGKIDTIIVKDLSRFGRNYIQVGQYIDYIFPAYGIRFIAIDDKVDTAERNSAAMDMMPIMNVFNEWHAANTSRKIRSVLKASWNMGKYTNWNYCYGYKVGDDENRSAVVDEDAVAVVRRIFDLRLQGNSYHSIARILTDENIPNPATYFRRKDGKSANRPCSKYWCARTVSWILSNPTYIGSMVQHKTTTVSYKNHKVVNIPKGEQIIKENSHEPIIDRETWDKVQIMGQKTARGRADKSKEVHPLSGLLVCADCGKKFKMKEARHHSGYYYYCSTYINLGKRYCSSHGISEKAIKEIVLTDLRHMMKNVEMDESRAREQFIKQLSQKSEINRYSDERNLKLLQGRLTELATLIQSAFEEKVLKKMPESVCISLCEKYEEERKTVEKEIAEIMQRLEKTDKDERDVEEYIKRLRAYSSCKELTREMCLQLIKFITVGEKGRDGEREIHIYYRFINTDEARDFRLSKF